MSIGADEFSGDAEQRALEQAIDPAVTSGQSTVAQGILQRYADSPGVIPMAHARTLVARSAWPGAGLPLLADIQRRHGSFGRSEPNARSGLAYALRPRAATMRPSSALARKQAFPVEASMPAVLAQPATGAMPALAEHEPELAPASDLGSRSGRSLTVVVHRSHQDPARTIHPDSRATSAQSIMPTTAEHGPEPAPASDLGSRSGQPLTIVVQRSQQDPTMAIHPDRSANSAQSVMPRAVAHGPELAPASGPAHRFGEPVVAIVQLARLALSQTVHAAGNLGKPVLQRQLDNADGRATQMNDAMDGISQPLGRVVTHSPHSAVAPLPPGQHRREAASLWPDDAPFTRPDAAPSPSKPVERAGMPAVLRQIAPAYPSHSGGTGRVMRQPLTLDSRAQPHPADGLPTTVRQATAADSSAAGSGGPPTPVPPAAAELPTMSSAETAPKVDLERLTDQVYRLLVRRLASERERRGL